MAGLTSIEATDTESHAYLRDPACGIPFDVHFEIEDDAGNSQLREPKELRELKELRKLEELRELKEFNDFFKNECAQRT